MNRIFAESGQSHRTVTARAAAGARTLAAQLGTQVQLPTAAST